MNKQEPLFGTDLAPDQEITGGVRLIGPLVFRLFVIARRLNVVFFRYEDAFGHQAWNTEFFARKERLLRGRRPLMIGVLRRQWSRSGNPESVANLALLEHHKKNGIFVVKMSLLRKLLFYGAAYQKIRYGKSWDKIGSRAFATASLPELHNDEGAHHRAAVAFPFVGSEKDRAEARLHDFGLESGRYYCFHDRGLENPDGDFGIDEYRGTSLESLYPGVEELSKQGLVGVRMGFGTGGKWQGPPIIDYAAERRDSASAFSDLCLLSMCKFFVGPGSGVQWCAMAFNRPVCLINAFPWPWTEVPMREDSVVIPKKYWLRDEKRYLTIQEAVSLEKKFHWKALYDKRSMDRLGFDVIPNSSEEIAGAMFEINDRIDGTWQGASFPITELLEKHSMGKHSKAFLGSKFSEKHGVAVPADCATQWRR